MGLIPGQGTKISRVTQCGQGEKKIFLIKKKKKEHSDYGGFLIILKGRVKKELSLEKTPPRKTTTHTTKHLRAVCKEDTTRSLKYLK